MDHARSMNTLKNIGSTILKYIALYFTAKRSLLLEVKLYGYIDEELTRGNNVALRQAIKRDFDKVY